MNGQHSQPAIEQMIPPLYIPRRWYTILQRLSAFEAGKAYHALIIMPKQADGEPMLVLLGEGKVENQR